MVVDFPYYEGIPPLDVPDENFLGVLSPKAYAPGRSVERLIRDALENPIGASHVSTLAEGASNALILTDDHTRNTPTRQILACLLPELHAADLSEAEITIMVAGGTHRQMTAAEMAAKFGRSITSKYRICFHDWRNERDLVCFGETQWGTPVRLNKILSEVDLIIGLGQITPHRIAGFSGGGKIVEPGISGRESAEEIHWRSAIIDGAKILGVADNPIREEIERIATRAGLRLIANAVCDSYGRLLEMFVGDPIIAHRKGAELARQVYGIEVRKRPDILVIDSYPMDSELWQAAKALYAAECIVKEGGVTILVSPCNEGVSQSHPSVLEFGYRSEAETMQLVNDGVIREKFAAAHLLRVGRIIRDKSTGILVTRGISKWDTEKLGFTYAKTPQEALTKALDLMGRDASVLVVQRGGTVLPILH